MTSLELNGIVVQFEVDTGAELSTIPLATYYDKLQHVALQPSSVILRQYDGTVLPSKGEITVKASQGQQAYIGSFIIVENADRQLPLLGRDWLYRLRLDWPKLFHSCQEDDPRVHTMHAATWINEFPDVTKGGLGLLKGISRPVPFALREQVEKVIQLWCD